MVVPFAAYLFVLQRLWFDAPIWDDFGPPLESVLHMLNAGWPREWLGALFGQHNEHRVAVSRLMALAAFKVMGHVDFRVLVFAGNMALVGLLLAAWLEFRRDVAPPLLGAAAFLLLQWSYHESALMAMPAASNFGVIMFAFFALRSAVRPHARDAVLAIAFALLAVGSQAGGLFVLPIATAGCALQRRPRRAIVFAVAAIAVWLAYFHGYVRPAHHPSPLAALLNPLVTIQLFLIIVGGIAPLGAILLVAIALLVRAGIWRTHPAPTLWLVFLLVSAAAMAVGRAGFGVFHASRYMIVPTCFGVVVFLLICAKSGPWPRRAQLGVLAGAAFLSLVITAIAWRAATLQSLSGRLLGKAELATPQVKASRYFGVMFPGDDTAAPLLDAVGARGIYKPAATPAIHETSIETRSDALRAERRHGHLDTVEVAGKHLKVRGWTDILPFTAGRKVTLYMQGAAPQAATVTAMSRTDVALELRSKPMVASGLQIDLDFASEEDARRVAAQLCVVVQAPGQPATVLQRAGAACEPSKG